MFSLSQFSSFLALLSPALAAPTELQPRQSINAYTAPRLVNYVQTFRYGNGNRVSLAPLVDQGTGITHVNLAALHINDDPNGITLNDNSPDDAYYDQTWQEVQTLQSQGVKVLFMLGGAAKGSYLKLCSNATPGTKADQDYYNALVDTIRAHNIDGVDLDIEESVDVSCALALLQHLHASFGPDFLLTMAPVASAMWPSGPGLSGFDYPTLDAAATEPTRPNGKLVNWYNAQFYNGWGDASAQDFYNAIITMGNWKPERVVMGVLDNSADGGSGFVALETLKGVIKQLQANYPAFGCAVGWEYWNAGATDGYASPWQWVKEIGNVVFQATALPTRNLTVASDPQPPAPFQAETNALFGLVGNYFEAVRALNITNGDLAEAEKLLGLDDLLGGVLGDVLSE